MEDVPAGDIFYFPRGYAHVIQNSGTTPATFILIFDDGHFSEYATFSSTDWLAHTPKPILAETLGVSEADLQPLPTAEVYIVPGPVPPPLDQDLPATLQQLAPESCAYRFSQQPAERHAGGSLKIVSQEQFPRATTITGALMTIDPGAVREPHWHPNASEWLYVLEGSLRVTLFASQGRARTETFEAGDVGYMPRGLGHYLENIGDGELRILLGFNTGTYEQISLSGWLAANPRQLVATNFNLDLATVDAFPNDTEYIPKRS